jgi:hypothetical protein
MQYIKYFEQFQVYHGSGVKFDKFDSEKLKSSMSSTTYGWGFYFTDSEEVAKNYASENDEKYIYHITLHKGKSPDMYDYLIFDESLSVKQKIKVIKGLKKNGIYDFDMSNIVTGWDLMSSLFEYFYKSYDDKTRVINGYNKCKKDTSLLLLDCGIDGLKYKMPNNDFSHESGYKGYNYVVFDSKNIFIDKKEVI